jgi:PD-(D/E)XK nuclease superfamily
VLRHEELTGAILGAAFEVHSMLGAGLVESAYDECLCSELALRGIPFERQVPLPLTFKKTALDCGVAWTSSSIGGLPCWRSMKPSSPRICGSAAIPSVS